MQIDTVFDLRTLSVSAGVTVTLGGFLSDDRVDGVRQTGFALQQYVAGPGVEAGATQYAVDLVSSARAVAPARGIRTYWPKTDRVPGEIVSGRELAAFLVTEGSLGNEFALSGLGPHQIQVAALISR